MKLSLVSHKLRNGDVLGGGKLSSCRGVNLPPSPARARGSTRAADCQQGSTLLGHGTARLTREQLSLQQSQLLLVPKGVQCVCQKWDFEVADVSQ